MTFARSAGQGICTTEGVRSLGAFGNVGVAGFFRCIRVIISHLKRRSAATDSIAIVPTTPGLVPFLLGSSLRLQRTCDRVPGGSTSAVVASP